MRDDWLTRAGGFVAFAAGRFGQRDRLGRDVVKVEQLEEIARFPGTVEINISL